jgi:hypothetical protein
MTGMGFIENLASRAADNPPAVAIKPAISPEMLPDVFSPIVDVTSAAPASEPVPIKRNFPAPVRRVDEKALEPAKEKSPLPAIRKDNDIVPEKHMEKAKPASPAPHEDVKMEPPAFRARLPAAAEPEHKISVTKDAEPHVRAADGTRDDNYIPPALARQTSPKSPAQQTLQKDDAAAKPSAKPVQAGTAAHPKTGPIKGTVAVRPEANSVEVQARPAAPYAPRTSFVQQRRTETRPTKHAQDQASGQDDDVVTINIGRIEVRAVFPQKHAPPAKEQGISLSEYLKLRAEGKL